MNEPRGAERGFLSLRGFELARAKSGQDTAREDFS
jgi:hypothetical protein